MNDLNMFPKIYLSVNMFSRYYNLASLRNCVSKNNAKDILDFYSNHQDEIFSQIGGNHWMKHSLQDLLNKCTSMISEEELFSYVNIDSDGMYKRARLNSVIKI